MCSLYVTYMKGLGWCNPRTSTAAHKIYPHWSFFPLLSLLIVLAIRNLLDLQPWVLSQGRSEERDRDTGLCLLSELTATGGTATVRIPAPHNAVKKVPSSDCQPSPALGGWNPQLFQAHVLQFIVPQCLLPVFQRLLGLSNAETRRKYSKNASALWNYYQLVSKAVRRSQSRGDHQRTWAEPQHCIILTEVC